MPDPSTLKALRLFASLAMLSRHLNVAVANSIESSTNAGRNVDNLQCHGQSQVAFGGTEVHLHVLLLILDNG
jgi:hypothetical protein